MKEKKRRASESILIFDRTSREIIYVFTNVFLMTHDVQPFFLIMRTKTVKKMSYSDGYNKVKMLIIISVKGRLYRQCGRTATSHW
jgi:hypothetical protein